MNLHYFPWVSVFAGCLWLVSGEHQFHVVNAQEQAVFQELRSFKDGANPRGRLLQASDQSWYGTTSAGGEMNFGTVFKLSADGSEYQILHCFGLEDGDGGAPSGLIEGSDGALYGTTARGGTHHDGTIFKIGKDGGDYTILQHKFEFRWGLRGSEPLASLLEATDGKLYGTTSRGGVNAALGTAFRIDRDGSNFEALHFFGTLSTDGVRPTAGLIEGTDGALYGTTLEGGLEYGGTVFRLLKDGSGYKVLWNFSYRSTDGSNPAEGVIEGSDGALYGTTSGVGTVFKLNKDGNGFIVLHRFLPGLWHAPTVSGLVEGTDGALYGTTTTSWALTPGNATVFRLNKDGSGYTVLHTFDRADATAPNPLFLAKDGTFYGTTWDGGELNLGTIFKVTFAPSLLIQAEHNVISLDVMGRPSGSYEIQAASSLSPASWEVIGTATADSSGLAQFSDSAVNDRPRRFYRAFRR
jgi:uncharacterized repeat protein (TIGR03803 family)